MDEMAASRIFRFDEMPVRKMANGGESRDVMHGRLPTGEAVSLHESMQVAGAPPNPAHRIEHSEVIMIQQGTMEFNFDGKSQRGGPGSVFYIARGTMHSAHNVGDGPAKYFVVAVGGDVKA
jgi:quercetin dioxygenase-like cupin family protein